MFHGTRKVGFVYMALLVVQAQNHPVKNVVLVHGAWADGSGWKGVYDILVKDGYNVTIVQEPETTFQEDVAATKRVLALQDGPCILVAHSYGGAVITEAGTGHPWSVWCTSRPTCQMRERMSLTTESASPATSANLTR
jgi:pimeloyl-ACP methyl ester carboxylesterase